MREGQAYCCRCRAPRRYHTPRWRELCPGGDFRLRRAAIEGTCEACGARILRIVPGEQVAGLLGPTRKPFLWDRRPRESEQAYRAFLRYRDLGEGRSLSRLAGELQGTGRARPWGRLTHWSRQWDWAARVEAWDDHQRRKQWEARRQEREKQNRLLLREQQLLGAVTRRLLEHALSLVSSGELDELDVTRRTVTRTVYTPQGKQVLRHRRPSVLDLIPMTTRMLSVGHRLERQLLGEEMRTRRPEDDPRFGGEKR